MFTTTRTAFVGSLQLYSGLSDAKEAALLNRPLWINFCNKMASLVSWSPFLAAGIAKFSFCAET
eukprot:IDg18747t1